MFNYKKVNKFLEIDFVEFIQDYFILKTNVNIDCSEKENDFSKYFCYSDFLIETILNNSTDAVREIVGMDLIPTYTYSGLYTKGDEVFIHKNKPTEYIECFLFLGSFGEKDKIFLSENSNGADHIEFELEIGDLLIFNGHKYWHWMDSLKDEWSLRSFLYFVENKEENESLFYDERPYLGFPKNS
jgi:hypothetical protein